jgi:hypothetical protein
MVLGGITCSCLFNSTTVTIGFQAHVIEVCSCEFKGLTASTTTCNRQQSKNIRTNSAIACNICNITKKERAIDYMDWKGWIGYMVELFFF